MRLIDAKNLKRAIMDSPFLVDWCKTAVNRIIDAQTTKDAEPVRHGEWKPVKGTYDSYTCSCCGAKQGRLTYTNHEYCGACGAKMDGGTTHD